MRNSCAKKRQHRTSLVNVASGHRLYPSNCSEGSRQTSRVLIPGAKTIVTEVGEEPLHTPQSRLKRRYESGDSPPATDHLAGQQGDESPLSPATILSQVYNLPSSPPGPTLETRAGAQGAARSSSKEQPSPSPYRPTQFPLSSPGQITSSEQDPLSSTLTYMPSERDLDIGKVLVRSFRIPNSCDEESMDRKEVDEEGERIHPAKALFALLMHAYSVGSQGRKIDEGELGF